MPLGVGGLHPCQGDRVVALGHYRGSLRSTGEEIDVEFHDASSLPYGGVTRGRAALYAQLERRPEETWLGTWGPLQPTDAERRMDPHVVAADGPDVTIVYTQRALSPGGEAFEAPVIGRYEVRDATLARAQMFHYDTAGILAFLERARSPVSGSGGVPR